MFVRGGNVYPGNRLGGAGDYGIYWSPIGSNSDRAYILYFSLDGVGPSDNRPRYNGFSVRCVALGG